MRTIRSLRVLLPAAWLFGSLPAATAAQYGDAPASVASAAERGDLEAVRALLAGGAADVNAAQGDGMTALHWAAEGGDLEIAQLLLSAGADAGATTRIGDYTPLHVAARRGHGPVGQLLIEKGANVRLASSNSGVTPLHLAAGSAGGAELVASLIAAGADVNAAGRAAGQTPVMFSAAYGRLESVRALLAAGADLARATAVVDVPNRLARDRAAQQAFQGALEGAHERAGGGDDWQPTPADVQGAVRAQREIFLAGKAVHDGPTGIRENLVGKTGGMTALLFAVRQGHFDVAMALLDAGANVDQVGGDHTSPLLMTTLNGHFDLALELLERGADPALAASTDGATPLFATLQTQWSAQTLYPQPRAIDLQRAEYMEVLEALLSAGADPNVRLRSHLWYWEYGYVRIGLDITGATPFWRAAFAQDVAAMKLLASYGADPHMPTAFPAVDMRETRQLDGRAREDSGLPKTPEGSPNQYPIHVAAGGGYTGLGAWTVRAVPDAFIAAVEFLVEEMGADVNGIDGWGYRPIHYATSRGDNEMIRYLVSKGAGVTDLTRLGQSPADLARGGQGGFFTRRAFPETQALLEGLGSPLVCMHVHFNGTGDNCHMAGKTELEDNYVRGAPMYTPREPRARAAGRAAPGGLREAPPDARGSRDRGGSFGSRRSIRSSPGFESSQVLTEGQGAGMRGLPTCVRVDLSGPSWLPSC